MINIIATLFVLAVLITACLYLFLNIKEVKQLQSEQEIRELRKCLRNNKHAFGICGQHVQLETAEIANYSPNKLGL